MFRAVLLLSIRLYWRFVSPYCRRRCLFRKSCSHYVFERTEHGGFFRGVAALIQRWRQCRPGYRFVVGPSVMWVQLCDGTVVDESVLAPSVSSEYWNDRPGGSVLGTGGANVDPA